MLPRAITLALMLTGECVTVPTILSFAGTCRILCKVPTYLPSCRPCQTACPVGARSCFRQTACSCRIWPGFARPVISSRDGESAGAPARRVCACAKGPSSGHPGHRIFSIAIGNLGTSQPKDQAREERASAKATSDEPTACALRVAQAVHGCLCAQPARANDISQAGR